MDKITEKLKQCGRILKCIDDYLDNDQSERGLNFISREIEKLMKKVSLLYEKHSDERFKNVYKDLDKRKRKIWEIYHKEPKVCYIV